MEKYIYRFIIEDNGPGIDKGIIEKAVKSIPLNYSQKEKEAESDWDCGFLIIL